MPSSKLAICRDLVGAVDVVAVVVGKGGLGEQRKERQRKGCRKRASRHYKPTIVCRQDALRQNNCEHIAKQESSSIMAESFQDNQRRPLEAFDAKLPLDRVATEATNSSSSRRGRSLRPHDRNQSTK